MLLKGPCLQGRQAGLKICAEGRGEPGGGLGCGGHTGRGQRRREGAAEGEAGTLPLASKGESLATVRNTEASTGLDGVGHGSSPSFLLRLRRLPRRLQLQAALDDRVPAPLLVVAGEGIVDPLPDALLNHDVRERQGEGDQGGVGLQEGLVEEAAEVGQHCACG
eukprot:EG_transcript_28854